MGDILPTIVWPSDLDALKRKQAPLWDTTDRAVKACAEMTDAEKLAWATEYKAWSAYRDEATPIFGLSNKWEEGLSYQRRLSGWQDIVDARCHNLPGPKVESPPDSNEAVKWIAGAAIVVALVYGARLVLR